MNETHQFKFSKTDAHKPLAYRVCLACKKIRMDPVHPPLFEVVS